MEESFYLTLLSNSSMSYFPQNTTANFSTMLPKSIKLEGEWVVGLVEFHYPCTMFNVQEYENVLYIKKNVMIPDEEIMTSVEYKSHIPATNYESIDQMINALNENSLIKNNVTFSYDKSSKIVHLTDHKNETKSIKLTPKLGLQLGFEPYTNMILNSYGKYPYNLYLGLPSQLFVYCDIIDPQMVGDVMTSLLRIIPLDPIKYIYGAHRMHTFSPAHYLPIMRREFDTVEIDIRTSTGGKIPFQFGTSCVKLHFKRIK